MPFIKKDFIMNTINTTSKTAAVAAANTAAVAAKHTAVKAAAKTAVKPLAQSTLERRARVQAYANSTPLTRAAGLACNDSAAIAALKLEGLDTLYTALKERKHRPQLPAIVGIVLGYDFSAAPNPQSLAGFSDFNSHVAAYVDNAMFKTKVAKMRAIRCIGMLRAAQERAVLSAQADKVNQAKQ